MTKQKTGKKTNKLVLIDFTAMWCKPCRKMEQDFWYNTRYKTTLDKFIIVSVDIDRSRDITQWYNVVSITNIKLLDVNGDVIYETLGFNNADSFNKELNGFPKTSEDLYETLNFKNKKAPTDEELLNLATSYQILLQKSKNNIAKNRFLVLSNVFFNKSY